MADMDDWFLDADIVEFGDDFFSICLGIVMWLIVLAINCVIAVFGLAFFLAAACFEIGLGILGLGDDD